MARVPDSGTIILVKGTSGSGKSTRVYCFLDYLEHIGLAFEPFYWVNRNNERKEVGMYVPDLDLICLGKFYTDNGVRKWQGLDSVTGRFVDSAGLSEFLQEMGQKKHNILLEGAGTSVTWRLRPMELTSTCEFLNILYMRYDFTPEEHDEYFKRVEYRSGKVPKGDAMWRKRKGFQSDLDQSLKEQEELNAMGANIEITSNTYMTPPWDLGCKVFEFFEMGDLCEEFKAHVEAQDYINHNRYEA